MVFPFNDITDFNISLRPEHELFRKSVRKFAEDILEPLVPEIERGGEIPEIVFDKAREAGLFGVGVPEEYGGQGEDIISYVILKEELARVCPAFSALIGANHLFMIPVLLFGNEEQKRKYIPPVARGEKFAAHANTEPCCGSDIAGIQTTATLEGNKYIINGRKIFITNAGKADYFFVTARTSPPKEGKRWWGITAFIVEKSFPGVKIGSKFDVIGLNGEHPYEVILDSAEVPIENVLNTPYKNVRDPVNEGFKIALITYDRSRIGIAAQGVGIAEAVLEKALKYSLERHTFGQPIISYQGISFKIADMLINLQAARLLTYWAATLAIQDREEYILAASLAKTLATEVAEKSALYAIKIHGGLGVDKEVGIERYLRDAVITTIYEGTNDIQRLTIIRQLLKRLK